MKKILIITLILSIIVLSGCNESTEPIRNGDRILVKNLEDCCYNQYNGDSYFSYYDEDNEGIVAICSNYNESRLLRSYIPGDFECEYDYPHNDSHSTWGFDEPIYMGEQNESNVTIEVTYYNSTQTMLKDLNCTEQEWCWYYGQDSSCDDKLPFIVED